MPVIVLIVAFVAILWISRGVLFARLRDGRLTQRKVAFGIGGLWALLPFLFELTSPDPFNWIAATIASMVLFASTFATTEFLLRRYVPQS